MSIVECIACGKLIDIDFEEEKYNFDTLQCEECDILDEEIAT